MKKASNFFTSGKPGVPINALPKIRDLCHFIPGRVPCTTGKGGVGGIAAAVTLTVAHKGPHGTSVSCCLPLDKPTYRQLGFENKFSPLFEFETGARIEPPATEN